MDDEPAIIKELREAEEGYRSLKSEARELRYRKASRFGKKAASISIKVAKNLRKGVKKTADRQKKSGVFELKP